MSTAKVFAALLPCQLQQKEHNIDQEDIQSSCLRPNNSATLSTDIMFLPASALSLHVIQSGYGGSPKSHG